MRRRPGCCATRARQDVSRHSQYPESQNMNSCHCEDIVYLSALNLAKEIQGTSDCLVTPTRQANVPTECVICLSPPVKRSVPSTKFVYTKFDVQETNTKRFFSKRKFSLLIFNGFKIRVSCKTLALKKPSNR